MTPVAILGAIAGLLLLPLAISVVRHRSLGALAVRNLGRRRGEAALVTAGALLGTAIITSSFVVGDIIDGSITDAARTQLGPVDITLTAADPTEQDAVVTAIRDEQTPAVGERESREIDRSRTAPGIGWIALRISAVRVA